MTAQGLGGFTVLESQELAIRASGLTPVPFLLFGGVMGSAGWNGHARRQLSERVRREETHCAWCRRPLYPDLEYPDPWATTVDHLVPIALGGAVFDRANLAAMHAVCNREKGTTSIEHRPDDLEPSRDW